MLSGVVPSKPIFHHIGIPLPLEKLKDYKDVKYSPLFDMYSLNLNNDLFIPMEYHAFGPNSSLHERIRTERHVAFRVSNIEAALHGKEVLMPLYQPFAGYRCSMITLHDQLIELIETDLPEEEIWGDGVFKESLLYPRTQ